RLLHEKLASIVSGVPDADLDLVLRFCHQVDLAWNSLDTSGRDKLRLYIERTDNAEAITWGYGICALQRTIDERVQGLPSEALAVLASSTRKLELLDEVVRRFESTSSFSTFKDLRPTLKDESLLAVWSLAQKRRLVAGLATNQDLR